MKRIFFFRILTIALVIAVLEIIGWISINKYHEDYQKVRKILKGEESYLGLQFMISQPYMLYIPSPNLHVWGSLRHNEHGYRGDKVSVIKEYGTYRILFMGGSTTFSMMINDSDSTYPAISKYILQKALNKGEITDPAIKKFEVINAGVPWGTSAEIITHYLFKFRYYDPDLVVINTGGNDAYAHFIGADYQPDYNHFRKTMVDIRPVKKPYRWLFNSNLFSFITISMFYDDHVKGGQFYHNGEHLNVRWVDNKQKATNPIKKLKFNAFYNHLNTVIQSIRSDSAEVLLVPFLGNWENEQYTDTILNMHFFYNDLLETIAEDNQVHFAPFDPEVITNKNYWMDDCHLNEEGVIEKARHLSKYILAIINKPPAPESN